ncbi:protein Frey 1 [Lathamus discolor]|uniref:protein Frey 1 n=1 Tax=Lathamus discolor TaxID=678569 RepID=UPI0032B77E1F
MQWWLLLFSLLLGAALPRPLDERASYSVPEDFSALLELPQQHFGLVDDYGIKPKQPRLRTRVGRKRPEWLQRAGKGKRDDLDLQEYYDDAHL